MGLERILDQWNKTSFLSGYAHLFVLVCEMNSFTPALEAEQWVIDQRRGYKRTYGSWNRPSG